MDNRVSAGRHFDREIEDALAASRCVVVLWSLASVQSDWVRAEAEAARVRRVVVPVRLERCRLPVIFSLIQTPSLEGWKGGHAHPALSELQRAVAALLDANRTDVRPERSSARRAVRVLRTRALLALGATLPPTLMAILAGSVRLPAVEIAIEAKVTATYFQTASGGELAGLLSLTELRANGLRAVRLPRSFAGSQDDGRLINVETQSATVRRINDSRIPSKLALEPLDLRSKAKVDVVFDAPSQTVRLSIADGINGFRLSALGKLAMQVPVLGLQAYETDVPRAIRFELAENEMDLLLTQSEPRSEIVPIPIRVASLSLSKVNERETSFGTAVNESSTVLSGSIRMKGAWNSLHELDGVKVVRLIEFKGTLSSLVLEGDGMTMRANGTVQTIKSCAAAQCESMMPSYLEWFLVEHRTLSLALAICYGAIILFTIAKLKAD